MVGNNMNKYLLYLILALTVVGLIFVADISAPQGLNYFNDKYYFLKSQAIAATIGLSLMIVLSFVNYKFYQKIATSLFIVSFLLLVMVLIPEFSYQALGARRWISVFGFNFQPSEIIKLFLIIYLAKIADLNIKSIKIFVPFILTVGLIMLQPDLGTTLIIAIIFLSQIFVAGMPLWRLLISLLVGLFGAFILILTSPYRRDRVITFFENTSDPLGKGYHIRQILLALGSGGLFGLGIGQSKQKYLFLPEAATDSIFAAIAEEIGFVGSLVIIVVFLVFIYQAFKIASNARDNFSKLLACGIATWIGGQMILNISSMLALTPLTGVPLPFFSFGGTSLVMVLVGCGILLNISRYAGKKIITRR